MVGASRLAWESAVQQALLYSQLTSSHRETHSRPVKLSEEGTKCFLATNGRYLWQHKQTNKQQQKTKTQQHPTKIYLRKQNPTLITSQADA